MHHACHGGHVEVVKLLSRYHCSIEASDKVWIYAIFPGGDYLMNGLEWLATDSLCLRPWI